MDTEHDRRVYWENEAKRLDIESKYYQEELRKAHELLGRVIHQTSEHWDTVRLTKFYPTDNCNHRRTLMNPGGE